MRQVVPPKDRLIRHNESLDVLLRLIEMNVFAKCYPRFHIQLFSDLPCGGSTSKLYSIVPVSDVMVSMLGKNCCSILRINLSERAIYIGAGDRDLWR